MKRGTDQKHFFKLFSKHMWQAVSGPGQDLIPSNPSISVEYVIIYSLVIAGIASDSPVK
jgi:hypothetical protein